MPERFSGEKVSLAIMPIARIGTSELLKVRGTNDLYNGSFALRRNFHVHFLYKILATDRILLRAI